MIADEQPCILELCAQVSVPLDDFGRLRAAIHQIAEKDQDDARRSARSVVGTDQADQLGKYIVAPVNIPDRIDTLPRGDGKAVPLCGNRLALALPEHEKGPTSK